MPGPNLQGKPNRINLDMNTFQMFMAISEHDQDAMKDIVEIWRSSRSVIEGLKNIASIDAWDLYGAKLHKFWYYLCEEDDQLFRATFSAISNGDVSLKCLHRVLEEEEEPYPFIEADMYLENNKKRR